MNDLRMQGKLVECSRKCGQKMLIEEAMAGVSHTVTMVGTCWSCLSSEQQENARAQYRIAAQ